MQPTAHAGGTGARQPSSALSHRVPPCCQQLLAKSTGFAGQAPSSSSNACGTLCPRDPAALAEMHFPVLQHHLAAGGGKAPLAGNGTGGDLKDTADRAAVAARSATANG